MVLMAVLMFASCGKGDSSSSPRDIVDELISYTVAYRNEIKVAVENDYTEKFVLALEKYVDKVQGIKAALEKVDKNNVPANKMELYRSVSNEAGELVRYAEEYMSFSEFQQERIIRAFEKLDF